MAEAEGRSRRGSDHVRDLVGGRREVVDEIDGGVEGVWQGKEVLHPVTVPDQQGHRTRPDCDPGVSRRRPLVGVRWA